MESKKVYECKKKFMIFITKDITHSETEGICRSDLFDSFRNKYNCIGRYEEEDYGLYKIMDSLYKPYYDNTEIKKYKQIKWYAKWN